MKILKELENYIKSQNPMVLTATIHNDKLNRDFLFTYRKSKSHTRFIKIFDVQYGLNEIAEISYSITNSTYISTFETKEEFQGNGIGRLMFETALAQSDKLGSTRAHGQASPTNSISGVKHTQGNVEEQKVINRIYKKLGCTIHNEDSQNIDTLFNIDWESGERYNKASPLVKHLTDLILIHERSTTSERV